MPVHEFHISDEASLIERLNQFCYSTDETDPRKRIFLFTCEKYPFSVFRESPIMITNKSLDSGFKLWEINVKEVCSWTHLSIHFVLKPETWTLCRIFSTQWAAVRMVFSSIIVPPQPNCWSMIRRAIQGQEFGFASTPPTIRSVGFREFNIF